MRLFDKLFSDYLPSPSFVNAGMIVNPIAIKMYNINDTLIFIGI